MSSRAIENSRKKSFWLYPEMCIRRLGYLLRNTKCVHLHITGKVQKVGFRKWLNRYAHAHGIEGWCRNCSKGDLEAVLKGKAVDVEDMIRACWVGPEGADVTSVKVKWYTKRVRPGFKVRKRRVLKQSLSYQDVNSLPKKANGRLLRKGLSEKGEVNTKWSQGTAICIKETLRNLEPFISRPNYYGARIVAASNRKEIRRAASNKNLYFMSFPPSEHFIASPIKQLGISLSSSSRITAMIRSITNLKHVTKDLLRHYEIPVAKGETFRDLGAAQKYFINLNRPAVIKPVKGSGGKGITVDIRTLDDFNNAWHEAKKYRNLILVEELIEGVDLRIVVVGGKARAAFLRVPANVIGNGVDTILELVEIKNNERLKNPYYRKKPLVLDDYAVHFIKCQGYLPDSVPDKGEMVFFHLKANVGAGGDCIGVTEKIHKDIMELAEKASLAFGITEYLGIDILVENIYRPLNGQRCVVCEVNTRANIPITHYPQYGTPYNAAQAIIDNLFPEDTENKAYPYDQLRMEVSGTMSGSLLSGINTGLQRFDLTGHVTQKGQESITLVVAGRRKQVYSFIHYLWTLNKTGDSFVDKVRAFKTQEAVSSLPLGKERGHSIYNEEKCNPIRVLFQDLAHIQITKYDSYDPHLEQKKLSNLLFVEAFKSKGYTAEFKGECLFEVRKDNVMGICSKWHSSFFTNCACRLKYPANRILSMFGLPVPRGVVFKADELKRAVNYFGILAKPCVVYALGSGKQLVVGNADQIAAFWEKTKSIKKRVIFLVEEYLVGFNIHIAVVGNQAVAALLIEPISLVGDGSSTIEQLIQEKNTVRLENPFYKDRLIGIDGKLKKELSKLGYDEGSTLQQNKKLSLERMADLEVEGESINISALIHSDFMDKAVEAVSVIPGLEFAFVEMIIPFPSLPAKDQKWVVSGINSKPNVSLFHFPFKGVPFNLSQRVVSDLCLTDRSKWFHE